MKKILIPALLLFGVAAFAQNTPVRSAPTTTTVVQPVREKPAQQPTVRVRGNANTSVLNPSQPATRAVTTGTNKISANTTAQRRPATTQNSKKAAAVKQ